MNTRSERWAFPLDFRRLTLRRSPNQYLVLPPDFSGVAAAHSESPAFEVSAEMLRERWKAMVERQPRVSRVREDAAAGQIECVERSRIMRFPDTITAEFIPLEEGRSRVAIYSHARYGYRDFGVNRARITRWLALLADETGDVPSQSAS
jgi:uncharacterized protein (DUF1499 family)